jgi:hypothetical protein
VHHGGQAFRRTVAAFAVVVETRLFSTQRQKAVAPPTTTPPPMRDALQSSDASSLATPTFVDRPARAPILMTLRQRRRRVFVVAWVPKVRVGAGELHGPSSLAFQVEGDRRQGGVAGVLFLTTWTSTGPSSTTSSRVELFGPLRQGLFERHEDMLAHHRKSPSVAPGLGRLVTGSVDYHAPARITSWRAVCTLSGRLRSHRSLGREGNCDSC